MKILIDFIVLAMIYIFILYKKWKLKGKEVLFANTLMYLYLSFVLYFTLMPIITSLPFMFNHPYTPMNLIPIVEWKDGQHHHKDIDENTIEVSFKRKRINPQKKQIKFDESIHLMETNDVLKSTDPMYPVIRVLQDLRNRLHLDKAKQLMDSDYNSFDE